jgi:hypothetical protein
MPKVIPRVCWKPGCERGAVKQMEGDWCCDEHPKSSTSNAKIENVKKIRHVKSVPDLPEVNNDFPIDLEDEKCIPDVSDEEKEPIVFVGKKRSGCNLKERGDSAKRSVYVGGKFPTVFYNNSDFQKGSYENIKKNKCIKRKKVVTECISSEGEEDDQNLFRHINSTITTSIKIEEDAPGPSDKCIPSIHKVSSKAELLPGPYRAGTHVIKETVKKNGKGKEVLIDPIHNVSNFKNNEPKKEKGWVKRIVKKAEVDEIDALKEIMSIYDVTGAMASMILDNMTEVYKKK